MTKDEAAMKIYELTAGCKHENWVGIPEVDAVCEQCGKDEMEVGGERNLRFKQILEIVNEITL